MAGSGKRKKGIAQPLAAPKLQSPNSDTGSETFYRVRGILAESQDHYKIAWEPNSQTGEEYKPTWEPKEYANELAIEDWERQKAAKTAKAALAHENSPSAAKNSKGKARLLSSISSPTQNKSRSLLSPPEAGGPTSKTNAKARFQPRQEGAGSEHDSDSGKSIDRTFGVGSQLEPEPEIGESQQQQQQSVQGGGRLLFVAVDEAIGGDPDPNLASNYTRGDYSKYPALPGDREHNGSPKASSEVAPSLPVSATQDQISHTSDAPAHAPSGLSPVESGSSRVIPDSQSQKSSEQYDSSSRGFSSSETQQATATNDICESGLQRSDFQGHAKCVSSAGSIVQDQAFSEAELEGVVSNGSGPQVPDKRKATTGVDTTGGIGSRTPEVIKKAAESRYSQSQPNTTLNARGDSGPDIAQSSEVESTAGRTAADCQKELDPPASTTYSKVAKTFKEPGTFSNNEAAVVAVKESSTAEHSALESSASSLQTIEKLPVISVPSTANCIGPVSSSTRPPRPPREAFFEPPTPGQRPPPYSASLASPLPDTRAKIVANQISGYKRAGSSPIRSASDTQSSFPFQTQLPLPDSSRSTGDNTGDHKRSRAIRLGNRSGNTRPSEPESPFSSSIPSVPSRVPAGKFGESAPERFLSLSNDTMSSSSPLLADTVRAAMAERKARTGTEDAARDAGAQRSPSSSVPVQPGSEFPANVAAEAAAFQTTSAPRLVASSLVGLAVQDSMRSPSAIPAVAAEPISTREEMTSSRRYSTLQPEKSFVSELPPKVEQLNRLATTTTQEGPQDPELASAHMVPVALLKYQRDPYECAVRRDQNRMLIERAVLNQSLDEDLLAQANVLLDELRNIALHPDLTNPETRSQTAEPYIQATWDVTCSAKFSFIKNLIDQLKESSLHVAILAHGPRVPNMLETFVRGLGYPCHRHGSEPSTFDDSPGFKITVGDLEASATGPVRPADVVIAVDALVNPRHALLRALRSRQGGWNLLLTLVVPRTVEHVERCLQKDIPAATRTRLLIKAIHELRCEAGRLESTQSKAPVAATLIAEFLKSPQGREWPVAGLTQLEDIDSQTETDLDNSLLQSSGTKRTHHEMATDNAPVKRVRLSPAPQTVNPQDLNMTHISDSMGESTQSNNVADRSLSIPTATEQSLKVALEAEQGRCAEFVRDLEELQYRYEDQRKTLVEVTRERDAAIRDAATTVDRMRGVEGNNATLRTERTSLKEALSAAKDALQNHTIPERHEFEALRAKIEAAQLDKDKAEKRAKATEKDLEWTRSMYQESSQRARELNEQVKDLEKRLSEALVKASGESARARKISTQGHNKALEQENQKLVLMVKSLESATKFKDDEIKSLKEASRGRLGTRQGSVPRSPRMGSPVKGRGSRAASPAVGDARGKSSTLHPLRQS